MILLVDDELFALEILKRKLAGEGFAITVARGVEEAIEEMKMNKEIRVLITDLHLSGDSGIEILEWTVANRPDVERIVLSAHTYEKKLSEPSNPPLCHHVFAKPVDVAVEIIPILKKKFNV